MAASKRKSTSDAKLNGRANTKKPKLTNAGKKQDKQIADSPDDSSDESSAPDLLDFDIPDPVEDEDGDSDFSGSFLSINTADGEEEGADDDGSLAGSDDESAPKSAQSGEQPREGRVEPDKTTAPAGQTSREAHQKQKVAREERKAGKPHADSMKRLKQIWGRLRRKSHVPLEERKALTKELYELIDGKEVEFVFKHDMVRVLQTALKYGNQEQRKGIGRAFKGRYRELAEGKYSKFFIAKILMTTFERKDTEIRDLIVPEFYGHVRRLMRHPEASQLVDDLYRNFASPAQKVRMLREWYGQGIALSDSGKSVDEVSLNHMLETSPEKRKPILEALSSLIKSLLEKHMVGFEILHDAVYQYQSALKQGSDEASEFFELLKSDEDGNLLRNLAFTDYGSRIVCTFIAQSAAKDRKYILKAFKQNWAALANDRFAYRIIIACFLTIDDTVQTSKAIFPELIDGPESLLTLANGPAARISLLYLPAHADSKLLGTIYQQSSEIFQDTITKSQVTSRKAPSVRHAELLAAQSALLLPHLSAATEALLGSAVGAEFLRISLLGLQGSKADVLGAIASKAGGDPSGSDHLIQKPWAARLLKSLVQSGHYDKTEKRVIKTDPPLDFDNTLYSAIKEHVLAWATGLGSFVILSLLESSTFRGNSELRELLRSKREVLEGASRHRHDEGAKVRKGDANGEKKMVSGTAGVEQILKELEIQ